MDKQKLNKKLAEWAEVKHEFVETGDKWGNKICKWCGFVTPFQSYMVKEPCNPDFALSLAACFKWLVPKLEKARLQYLIRSMGSDGQVCRLLGLPPNKVGVVAQVIEQTSALALCLAIEKLIDSQS